jgi:hypothetical protein
MPSLTLTPGEIEEMVVILDEVLGSVGGEQR